MANAIKDLEPIVFSHPFVNRETSSNRLVLAIITWQTRRGESVQRSFLRFDCSIDIAWYYATEASVAIELSYSQTGLPTAVTACLE